MQPKLALPFILAVSVTACSTSRQPTAERVLQKRRFQPGWHIDLGARPRNAQRTTRSVLPRSGPRVLTRAIPSGEPLAAVTPLNDDLADPRTSPIVVVPVKRAGAPTVQISTLERPDEPPAEAPIEPDARWNPWAGPALVLALGTVAYGLVGTSNLLLVFLVIATILLASIAVRKGRTYEWRGKGMAVAALVIGSLAALITLIALLGA